MTLTRRSDWVPRLFEYLQARSFEQFEWGKHDCVMFAAGAVKAMTDVDFTEDYPEYSTALQAARIIKEHGDLDAMVSAVLPETPVLMAQRGDVALLEGEGDAPALGIVVGSVVWGPSEVGLVAVPIERAKKAWKV